MNPEQTYFIYMDVNTLMVTMNSVESRRMTIFLEEL